VHSFNKKPNARNLNKKTVSFSQEEYNYILSNPEKFDTFIINLKDELGLTVDSYVIEREKMLHSVVRKNGEEGQFFVVDLKLFKTTKEYQ